MPQVVGTLSIQDTEIVTQAAAADGGVVGGLTTASINYDPKLSIDGEGVN